MAWSRPGDKPLSESMEVRIPIHICVTRPQLVNSTEFWGWRKNIVTLYFRKILSKVPFTWMSWISKTPQTYNDACIVRKKIYWHIYMFICNHYMAEAIYWIISFDVLVLYIKITVRWVDILSICGIFILHIFLCTCRFISFQFKESFRSIWYIYFLVTESPSFHA